MSTATTLRRIEPISTDRLSLAPIADDKPRIVWMPPTELMVDAVYQRELSLRSQKVLIRAVENFAWNRFKPPVAVVTPDGTHVIDGQHSAIAAASRGISEIPVMIVTAETLDERARCFVGHNRDRTPVSPIDIYKALLTSGDEDAQDVANVCRRAGVRIRHISPNSAIAPGDTAAIGIVRRLVKARGVRVARQALEVLVKARRAPLAAVEIMAVDAILSGAAPLRPDADLGALANVIAADGVAGVEAARTRAKRDGTAQFLALAQRWVRRLEKVVA